MKKWAPIQWMEKMRVKSIKCNKSELQVFAILLPLQKRCKSCHVIGINFFNQGI